MKRGSCSYHRDIPIVKLFMHFNQEVTHAIQTYRSQAVYAHEAGSCSCHRDIPVIKPLINMKQDVAYATESLLLNPFSAQLKISHEDLSRLLGRYGELDTDHMVKHELCLLPILEGNKYNYIYCLIGLICN